MYLPTRQHSTKTRHIAKLQQLLTLLLCATTLEVTHQGKILQPLQNSASGKWLWLEPFFFISRNTREATLEALGKGCGVWETASIKIKMYDTILRVRTYHDTHQYYNELINLCCFIYRVAHIRSNRFLDEDLCRAAMLVMTELTETV